MYVENRLLHLFLLSQLNALVCNFASHLQDAESSRCLVLAWILRFLAIRLVFSSLLICFHCLLHLQLWLLNDLDLYFAPFLHLLLCHLLHLLLVLIAPHLIQSRLLLLENFLIRDWSALDRVNNVNH